MASQRSLPFSPSTASVPVSQRPSQLPSSLATVGLSTKFESVTAPRGAHASSSASRHKRTGSAVSASRPHPTVSKPGDPSSPTRRAFTGSSSIPFGGTHTHGILPPPPFFHPSRPPILEPLSPSDYASRRSSMASSSVPSPSHDREVVHSAFPLLPLPHDTQYDSDGHSDSFPGGERTSGASMQDAPGYPSIVRNQKYSREPILLARNVVEKNAASSAARVRDSFERFRKGLSLESVRKSLSGSTSPSQSAVIPPLPSARSASNGPRTPFEIKESSSSEYKTSDVVTQDLRHRSSANFIPYPPTTTREHPLSSVPMKREKSSGYVRNYERIPSSNRWFFRGHLLMGGAKPWAFIASLTLVFGIAGVWLGTTCIWWWHNESPAVAGVGAYLCLLTISLMLSTALKDPGILPRNLDPDPPYPSVASPSDGGDYGPLTRELKVRSAAVIVKYCTTCRTYRPPRSNHCRVCDNCVDGCDHHCQWVNNCVGRRNYANFFALILVATLTLCLVIVTSALHLSILAQDKQVKTFSHALGRGVGSAVAFSLAVAVIWPVGALLAYHVRLLFLNVTTIEQIRNSARKSIEPGTRAPPNPFAHSSWRGNLADVLCRPGGFSWVEPHAVATQDRRLVNPGLEDQADFVVRDDRDEDRDGDT
ncbi:DHHC palmitoyltransferase-domain-containing protein [Russula earlei]|uniref:DHHC palmitoyltransferase-domain-containing protein n=1 Tax=Russula earlei TaxID=71964 RepID=A0ACC0UEP8_9AGAM|nr:DHHC palmitoyltransferase-domain-containing protein [Russula earlei]